MCLLTLNRSMFVTISKWIARISRKSCIKRRCLVVPERAQPLISGCQVFKETLKKPLLSIVIVVHRILNISNSSHLCCSIMLRILTQALRHIVTLCNSLGGNVCFSSNPCFTGDSPHETSFLEKAQLFTIFLLLSSRMNLHF